VNNTTRHERLAADREALQNLQDASTILRLEATGQPPDRYLLTFHGKGRHRDAGTGAVVEQTQHQCELRLSLSYPQYPPDVRWLTPLFHPNISFSGFIRLDDIGIPWAEDLTLDIVVERLWDVARLAYYDLETAANYVAKRWCQEQPQLSLPADPRPLRDKVTSVNRNIVRYRRLGDQHVQLAPSGQSHDILYIDENTPLPPLPSARSERAGRGDDVLYIGDD
jgi:ubiquitin-protein ligase